MMVMKHQWVNVDLPQTPPDTDNEHASLTVSPHHRHNHRHPPHKPPPSQHSHTHDGTRSKYVYTDCVSSSCSDDDEEEEDDDNDNDNDDNISNDPHSHQHSLSHHHHDATSYLHSHTHTLDSYGSDNDDINSDDAFYDEIDIATPITLSVTRPQMDAFHAHIYDYVDRTRATRDHCRQRYHILCLINDIWQRILMQREFDKKKFALDANRIMTDARYAQQHGVVIEEIYDDDADGEPYQCQADSVEWLTPCSSPRKKITIGAYNLVIPSASIFGSIRTRLDCLGSDMDITLPHSVDNPVVDVFYNKHEQKGKLSEFLRLLTEATTNISAMSSSSSSSSSSVFGLYQFEVFPVLNAKVPIIKLKETAVTQLEMDIAIQSSQQSVAKLINFYCACDDRVRPFIIAIKHWSKVRGICDAMDNYPNSFGFVLLTIKFLQMVAVLPVCSIDDVRTNDDADITVVRPLAPSTTTTTTVNTDTLLELLVQFFDMYHRFNFKLLQISTSRVGLESKANHAFYSHFKHAHQTTMVVEDPSCRSVNVTRNVRPYRLTIMQNEFLRGYKCCKHGDWRTLMLRYEGGGGGGDQTRETHIFEMYPPSDAEQRYLSRKLYYNDEKDEEEEEEEEGVLAMDSGSVGGNRLEMITEPVVELDILHGVNDAEETESIEMSPDGDGDGDEKGPPAAAAAFEHGGESSEPSEPQSHVACSLNLSVIHRINMNINVHMNMHAATPLFSPLLMQPLNTVLSDADVLLLLHLTPFKQHFNGQHLQQYNIAPRPHFIEICKYFIVAFSIEFLQFITANNINVTLDGNCSLFQILPFRNLNCNKSKKMKKMNSKSKSKSQNGDQFELKCLQFFSTYNQHSNWSLFIQEFRALLQTQIQLQYEYQSAMPYTLYSMLEHRFQLSNMAVYNGVYYQSFVLLFAFWKSLSLVVNNGGGSGGEKQKLSICSNKEWVMSKMRHSMNCVGMECMSQTQLLRFFKS